MADTAQREVVERALRYPYAAPRESFALLGGRSVGLDEVDVDVSRRTPLLAYGSNASPEVLGRKLAASEAPVAVIRGTLRDFDVVYSAHLSAYGSLPANLHRSPGTEAPVFVAYLTDEQQRFLDETEPNYERRQLTGIACALETGAAVAEAAVYESRHGSLLAEGVEIALSAIRARRRRLPEMSQREALEHVRAMLAPERSLERFILDWVSGDAILRARSLNRAEAP